MNETRESKMVVLSRDIEGTPTVWCDPEIVDLVKALNDAGISTVASCSGHGHRPGSIILKDGRELIIAKDFDEARKIDDLFPVDINGHHREPLPDVSKTIVPDEVYAELSNLHKKLKQAINPINESAKTIIQKSYETIGNILATQKEPHL